MRNAPKGAPRSPLTCTAAAARSRSTQRRTVPRDLQPIALRRRFRQARGCAPGTRLTADDHRGRARSGAPTPTRSSAARCRRRRRPAARPAQARARRAEAAGCSRCSPAPLAASPPRRRSAGTFSVEGTDDRLRPATPATSIRSPGSRPSPASASPASAARPSDAGLPCRSASATTRASTAPRPASPGRPRPQRRRRRRRRRAGVTLPVIFDGGAGQRRAVRRRRDRRSSTAVQATTTSSPATAGPSRSTAARTSTPRSPTTATSGSPARRSRATPTPTASAGPPTATTPTRDPARRAGHPGQRGRRGLLRRRRRSTSTRRRRLPAPAGLQRRRPPPIRPGALEVIGNAVDENCDDRDRAVPGDLRAGQRNLGHVRLAHAQPDARRAQGLPDGTRIEMRCTGGGCPKGVTPHAYAPARRP